MRICRTYIINYKFMWLEEHGHTGSTIEPKRLCRVPTNEVYEMRNKVEERGPELSRFTADISKNKLVCYLSDPTQ